MADYAKKLTTYKCVRIGDHVRAVHESGTTVEFIVTEKQFNRIGGAGSIRVDTTHADWAVFDVTPPLPVKPGVYASRANGRDLHACRIFILRENGQWMERGQFIDAPPSHQLPLRELGVMA